MVQNEVANITTITKNVRNSETYIIVDGGSSDGTDIELRNIGVKVVNNRFEGFASQRNFLKNEARRLSKVDYILYLDADEHLSRENIEEINRTIENNGNGLLFPFEFIYNKRRLKYSYGHPAVQRLFKLEDFSGEDQGAREYFSVTTNTIANAAIVHEDLKAGTSDELVKIRNNAVRESKWEESAKAKTLMRSIWIAAPPVLRSAAYFAYRYVLRGGFLDGRAGLNYLVLNVLIYRLLIDYERSKN